MEKAIHLIQTEDEEQQQFYRTDYRLLSNAKDKYNLDITVTLDYVPEGYDYNLILYDKHERLLGIGKSNGNGGKSITIPNWCMKDRDYTLKVQAKDGEKIVSEEDYHLSFKEDNFYGAYWQMKEKMSFSHVLRQKLQRESVQIQEKEILAKHCTKYEECYEEQVELPHNEVVEFYA